MPPSGKPQSIPVNRLRPDPALPGRSVSRAELEAAMDRLRERGEVGAILVRPLPGNLERYGIIRGVQLWRAAATMGWSHLSAVVRHDVTDEDALSLSLVDPNESDDDPLVRGWTIFELVEKKRERLGAKNGAYDEILREHSWIRSKAELCKLATIGREISHDRLRKLGVAPADLADTGYTVLYDLARRPRQETDSELIAIAKGRSPDRDESSPSYTLQERRTGRMVLDIAPGFLADGSEEDRRRFVTEVGKLLLEVADGIGMETPAAVRMRQACASELAAQAEKYQRGFTEVGEDVVSLLIQLDRKLRSILAKILSDLEEES